MGTELKFLVVAAPFLVVLLVGYKRLSNYYKAMIKLNDGLSPNERDDMIQWYVTWTLLVGSIFVAVAYILGDGRFW